MSFLKVFSKYRLHILFLSLILVGYFLLRLPNLTLQPIFVDEAIYIRWAQIMKSEPTLRFLPLSDGKTPLFMWSLMPLFVFISDPLFAGRIMSVFAGIFTLFGVLAIGWKFFNPRVGLIAALLVAILPFSVFFDRMALVDSMLAAFTIWSLFFALLLSRYPKVWIAMVLGYLLGGSVLSKTPGIFNIYLLPLTLIAFKDWNAKDRMAKLIRFILLLFLAGGIGFFIYNLLRLGPNFGNLSSRDQDYIYPLSHMFTSPLNPFWPHLKDLWEWLPILLTIPGFVLVVGGIISALISRNKYAVIILFWSLAPLSAWLFLLKATFTARYILFTIIPLYILAAYFTDFLVQRLKNKFRILGYSAIVLIILIFSSIFNYQLLTDPFNLNLPRGEKRGYFEDWTAGYGFVEIADYLKEQSKDGEIIVGTEGSFGTLPDGLWIYLDKAPNITIIGGPPRLTEDLKNMNQMHPVYFVANKSRVGDSIPGTTLIKEYPKVKGPDYPQDAILLFKVLP